MLKKEVFRSPGKNTVNLSCSQKGEIHYLSRKGHVIKKRCSDSYLPLASFPMQIYKIEGLAASTRAIKSVKTKHSWDTLSLKIKTSLPKFKRRTILYWSTGLCPFWTISSKGPTRTKRALPSQSSPTRSIGSPSPAKPTKASSPSSAKIS